jgi:hypothetical protein
MAADPVPVHVSHLEGVQSLGVRSLGDSAIPVLKLRVDCPDQSTSSRPFRKSLYSSGNAILETTPPSIPSGLAATKVPALSLSIIVSSILAGPPQETRDISRQLANRRIDAVLAETRVDAGRKVVARCVVRSHPPSYKPKQSLLRPQYSRDAPTA